MTLRCPLFGLVVTLVLSHEGRILRMDLRLLRVYQQQVLVQCQFALLAEADLRTASDMTRAWYAMQNLLTATANIAKACWGPFGKLASQREPLRQSIGIDDSSPLKDTAIRNDFEHFDDRLDQWWEKSSSHSYIDMNIADVPIGSIASAPEIDVFRNFNSSTGELTFWGNRYNIPAIMAEVRRIMPLVATEAEKPYQVP
jgi:hypothetical protein